MDDHTLHQTTPIHTWTGIAAEDRPATAITLKVSIPGLTPALTGTLQATTSTQAVSNTDTNGNVVNTSVTTTNAITCYYHGTTTNRAGPPDVVRGEQVKVTKYGDSDKYFWESMGRDDQLRTTETVRFEAKNRKTNTDPTDDAHSYSIELDSKVNQHIRLQTSTGNGEAHTYTLKLDGKSSKVQLSDELGNAILLDSTASNVTMRNAKGAFVMLNALDILLGAPRDILLKATRQMVIDTPLLSISTTTGGGVTAIVANAIALAAKSITLSAAQIGLNGAVQVPSTLVAGQLKSPSNLQTGVAVGAAYPVASINIASATTS